MAMNARSTWNSVPPERGLLPRTAGTRPLPIAWHKVEDLRNASPATVSRAGIIYVSDSDLDWQPVMESRLKKLPAARSDILRDMFRRVLARAPSRWPIRWEGSGG